MTLGFLFVILLLALQPVAIARAQAVAIPTVTLTLPETVYIGQDFSFTVAFDNASTKPGYGPYIDLVFPVNGIDGAAGTDTPDGVFFNSATFLGEPVTTTELVFPSTGGGCPNAGEYPVEHPYAVDEFDQPVKICGTTGDKLVVLQLPFGSFTGDQPPATLTVNATLSDLADLAKPLTIEATPGFQFGNDPLDNATIDESIIGAPVTDDVVPQLITIKKIYSGPEDETATGPNYPREYEIIVTIAPGQVVTNLDVRDLVPDNMQFLSLIGTSPAAVCNPVPSLSTPGGILLCTFSSVTGTAGNDAAVTFDYFIPQFDANNAVVINPTTGDDVYSLNDARAIGDWDPKDNRDPAGVDNAVADPIGPEHELEDQSIAIQKGVAVVTDVAPDGPSPGDILEYTLNVQISDFFAFESVVISDTISDGQHVLESYIPTMQVNGNGYTLGAANMNAANYAVTCNYTGTPGSECDANNPALNDGTTHLDFFISNELGARVGNDQWVGGCINPVNGTGASNVTPDCLFYDDGATTAQLTFRTEILQQFTDDYPSGDSSVDQGDILTNDVDVDGALLNVWNLLPNGQLEGDDSGASVKIVSGKMVKSVYAINGEICADQPCVDPIIAPDQTLTYRITYTLPSPDIEDLVFSDYLPLPIFEAGEMSTSFDATVSDTPPVGGQAKFGPDDTFFTLSGRLPTITTDTVANRVRFSYADYDNVDQGQRVIDMLFTVTATDKPFADRLYLTNQVRSEQGSTNGDNLIIDDIVFVQIGQPVLDMRKGVVAAYNADNTPNTDAVFSSTALPTGINVNAPGACNRIDGLVQTSNLGTTFDSDLSEVDAFDRVTYAIVVENTGTGIVGAYDVTIKDTLPAGVAVGDVSNLCMEYGDGTQPTVTDGIAELFGAGLEIIDDASNPLPPPSILGALGPGQTQAGDPITDGSNLIIITYDVVLPVGVEPGDQLQNSAAIIQYAGAEGGDDHIDAGDDFSEQTDDTSSVTIDDPEITKSLTDTNQAHTTDPNVTIGEIITYTVVIEVPEGTSSNATVVDTLDTGLAFVDCLRVTAPELLTDLSGGFNAACNDDVNPTVATADGSLTDGTTITFDLGKVTNPENDVAPETITIQYQAVVLNSTNNVHGEIRNNLAVWTWDGGSINDAAELLTIVEPEMTIEKAASPLLGDTGDVIDFTIEVEHTNDFDNTDAFDLLITDTIPSGLTYLPGSLDCDDGGEVPDSCSESTGTITATWSSFPDTGVISLIKFKATVDAGVTTGQGIVNTVDLVWTSLPDPDGNTAQSTYNTLSVERTGDTGDVGGAANHYADSDTATIAVLSGVPTKSILATSDSHTVNVDDVERVTIGEIVRYKLAYQMPEVMDNNFQLVDVLPAGMEFVNDGTTTIGFVANYDTGTGITSSTLISTTIGCRGPGFGEPVLEWTGASSAINPECPLPASAISTAANPGTGGVDLTFSLGDLVNTDTDAANNEYVLLDFNALVLNVAGNQAGTSLINRFSTYVAGSQVLPPSNAIEVRVVEPVIELQKDMTAPSPLDAGDIITYTLSFTNVATGPDGEDAFDLVLMDTLDSNLVLQTVTVIAQPTYAEYPNNVDISGSGTPANSVEALVNRLDQGDFVAIEVVATVNSVTPVGQTIPNSVDLTYTSLPGDNGTPANDPGNETGSANTGTPGSSTGERTGADGVVGVNDYVDADAVNVTLTTPAIVKLAPSQNAYPIGDLITYSIRITVPEGNTQDLRVIDILPAGLGYVSHSVITTQAASGGLLSADYNGLLNTNPTCPNCTVGNDGALTFTFGDTQTNGSGPANGVSNNQFLLQLVASVLNISANQYTSPPLTNTASLRYDDPTLGADQSVAGGSQSIEIVEPVLTIDKQLTDGPATPDAGDVITYTVTIAHDSVASGATAYDVLFSDALPAGLGSPAIISVNATGITPPSAEIIGTSLRVPNTADGTFDLPEGATVTVVFRATVSPSIQPNETVANVGQLTWSSLDGPVSGERTDGDSLLDQGGLNDYEVQASATFIADGLVIHKDLLSTSADHTNDPQGAIGEVVTYTLAIILPEGSTPSLQIIDALPAGLAYVGGSVTVDAPNYVVPAPTVAPVADGNPGDDVTIDFGAISVPGDNDPANDGFTVYLRARVVDAPGNVGLPPTPTTLPNSATAQAGVGPVLTSNTVNVTVVEPRMTIDKVVNQAKAAANDTVTFTLTISNTGLASAFEVVVSDTVPAGMTYVPSSLDCDDGAQDPNICDDTGGVMKAEWTSTPFTVGGGNAIIRFRATLNPGVVLDEVITNTATVEQATTLPGAVTGERDEPDVSDTASVTVIVPDIALTKSDSQESALPGVLLVYDLTVTNDGERGATGVIITDTVPANATFDLANSSATWSGCVDGAPAGTVCTYTVGDLAANGGDATVQFAVQVDDPLPASISQIVNRAAASDDRSHGIHPEGPVGGADDTNGVQFIGDLVWYDINQDGSQNPGTEPGIAGITVQLLDGGSVVGSAETNASGVYTFHVIADKVYDVRIDPAEFQSGGDLEHWTGSPQNANPDGALDSDADPNTHTISNASTTSSVNNLNWDFGVIVDIGYTIEKSVSDPSYGGPIRTGEAVAFTISIHNTGVLPLTSVPLQDVYLPQYMTYVDATSIDPDSNTNDGTLNWSDLTAAPPNGVGHALAPNETVEIIVEFTGRLDTTLLNPPTSETINTATVINAFADDTLAVPNQSASDGISIFNPTATFIEDREVKLADGIAQLSWKTVDESPLAAFNLYRYIGLQTRVKITPNPIAAQFAGQPQGTSYIYEDQEASGQAYRYELEVLLIDGGISLLDMGSAQVNGKIFLPIFTAGP